MSAPRGDGADDGGTGRGADGACGRTSSEGTEHLIATQEEERRAIARELHDGIGQSVTAILVGLRSLEALLPDTGDTAAARDLAHHLAATALETLNEIGRIARGLRPSVLDHAGLAEALRRHIDDFQLAYGLEVELHVSDLSQRQRLPPAVETTCYRIVQEALTNVGKHAAATRASVIVERLDQRVRLIIEDDGRGIDPTRPRDSRALGLLGIRERVALLGGTLEVESSAGQGTTLFVHLPLNH